MKTCHCEEKISELEESNRLLKRELEITNEIHKEDQSKKENRSDDYRTVPIEDFFVTWQASRIIDKLLALKQLDLPACWIFEGDDSPEHYETCASLIRYFCDFGGKLIRLDTYSVEHICHEDSVSSGRFVVQLD